jgi:FkbM family methyltransferase
MNRLFSFIQLTWANWRLKNKLVKRDQLKLVKLGTDYAGWVVPASVLQRGNVALCVGAGEDVSFDVELNKKGLDVYCLDPTPRVTEHIANIMDAADGGAPASINHSKVNFYDLKGFDKKRFKFLNIGVWDKNTTARFYTPSDPNHVSHSLVNIQHTDNYFEAKCMTLNAICEQSKIEQVDILKIDVEGAEQAILKNLVGSGIPAKVLCVDFDEMRKPLDNQYMNRISESIDLLKSAGYMFMHLEKANALFVRADLV